MPRVPSNAMRMIDGDASVSFRVWERAKLTIGHLFSVREHRIELWRGVAYRPIVEPTFNVLGADAALAHDLAPLQPGSRKGPDNQPKRTQGTPFAEQAAGNYQAVANRDSKAVAEIQAWGGVLDA